MKPLIWRMLLANSSVSGKAATGHVLKVRSHRRLPPNTRSSSKIIAQIGKLGVGGKRTPEVLTNLSCGRFVLCWWIGVGIEALAKPIFVRGVSPFNGWRPVPPSPRIQNHCAKSGSLGFFNELRKRVRTSHVGGSFSVWGIEEGIEALAEPIFVRGVSPFNGSGTAVPFNGWHAPCLAGMSHARTLRLIVRGG